jgi:BirA family transcriptional regulator, biotin operon repressor / biotin---[acetyl-CoA-carboxylase] ligase
VNWRIIHIEKTRSTMIDALAYPAGTVVVADEQTSGQGRLGRRWQSEPGAGLYLSAVMALPCHGESAPVITLALGLAVQETLQHLTGASCDLRWPNDVLIGGRKCVGILVQLHGNRVIAGIGVNVNQSAFPEELSSIATSLQIETGQKWSRQALLDALLETIDSYSSLLRDSGTSAILRLFTQASSYVSGRKVDVDNAEQSLSGVTDGLDESGFLWVRSSDGRRHLIRAGGIRPA